jgi:hypothetical protein
MRFAAEDSRRYNSAFTNQRSNFPENVDIEALSRKKVVPAFIRSQSNNNGSAIL